MRWHVACRNFHHLLVLLLWADVDEGFSWHLLPKLTTTTTTARIHRSRVSTAGADVTADIPLPTTYHGPLAKASEMKATVQLEKLGLALEVGPSSVAPGELGMFVRLRDGVKQSKCWWLTVLCDYARDGTFRLVDSGDKAVWFVLKSTSGVVFDGQVMSIGAALERASVVYGCDCGLAGHKVGRRRGMGGDAANDDGDNTNSGTVTVEVTTGADDEQYKRCFIPSMVEEVTGKNFGQFANDLAWGDPPPACEAEYNACAARNNCLSLIWSVAYDDVLQQLVPRWPMYVLSRDVEFENKEPMEVGGSYGWAYWQVPTREDRISSDRSREVIVMSAESTTPAATKKMPVRTFVISLLTNDTNVY